MNPACLRSTALLVVLLFAPGYLIAQKHGGGGGGRAPHGAGSKHTSAPPAPKIAHEAPLEKFQRMSPAERESALAKLPADRREKLQRQLQHYDQLTPAQREQLDWFNHLTPERQEAFRKVFHQFQTTPPERQQVLKEEIGRLRAMPKPEREALLASPEFKTQYDKSEQQILQQMSEILPHYF